MKRIVVECSERFPDYSPTEVGVASVSQLLETVFLVPEEQFKRWRDTIDAYVRVQAEIKDAYLSAKIAKVERKP